MDCRLVSWLLCTCSESLFSFLVFISLTIFCWYFFFFFQAEDGIRDIGVTGVQTWLLRSEVIKHDHPVALFPFNERAGKIVHNQVASGPDLNIPESYDVPYKPFLEAPWKEFYPNWAYLQDILINIVGFIPLGFFFCAARARGRPGRKAVIVTIV